MLSHFVPFQRSRARVRQAVRATCLVIAALGLLGAQLLSTLHFVLVPHHLCATHGVLEDGATQAKAGASEAVRHSSAVEDGAPTEQDEHDACSAATPHGHGVLLQRPALQRAPLAEAHVLPASPGVSLNLARAVLLARAPKTSPPVRA